MNREEYEVMYQVEDHHWWYLGMERITHELLERALPPDREACSRKILDAGCGTGAVMKYLARYGEVTGFDFSAEALKFSRRRGHTRLAQASVLQIPLASDQFDAVVSFDVICETGVDDRQALREFTRVLKPGGIVLLRLPAYSWMRGQHDVAVHVAHRYTRGEVSTKLRDNGLMPLHTSYANTFLFPIAVAKRWSERFLPQQQGSDLTLNPGTSNGVLRAILSAEAPLIKSIGLPFGLTVTALARKDAGHETI
jgi:ubiquinone/menaquinone biosynthesis C-methylase UbiE